MAQDLFTRTTVNFGGAFTAEKGLLVPNNGLTGVLMQNYQIQYGQMVTRLYEIGNAGQPTNVYYVGGRAAGNLSAGHVIGPGTAVKAFYQNFSDVCQAGQNDCKIQIGPNICGVPQQTTLATQPGQAAGGIDNSLVQSYNAKFCVLVSIGLATTAQEFVLNEQSQLMFSGLEVA